MNNINELASIVSDYISKDELKVITARAMNNARTIEELLVLKWSFSKLLYSYLKSSSGNNFSENIERICYEIALSNSSSIIEDLINNYTLEQIMEKYCITRESIKRVVLNYLETDNYNQDILSMLDSFNKSIVPEHDREFVCAVTAIYMFINSDCYTSVKISAKFNCNEAELRKYLHILEAKDCFLYDKYIKLYKAYVGKNTTNINNKRHQKERELYNIEVSKIANLSSKEILRILSNPNYSDKLYVNFCVYYGLDTHFLIELLKDNEGMKDDLAKNKDNIFDIYRQYSNLYRTLVKSMISNVKTLSKDKFTKPLNLYNYYCKTKFDIKVFARFATTFSDIKNNVLISNYFDMFPSVFDKVSKEEIISIRQKKVFSCCKDSIPFSIDEFNKAVHDIEENDMPLVRGVLYGALKRQKDIKNSKVKQKILC